MSSMQTAPTQVLSPTSGFSEERSQSDHHPKTETSLLSLPQIGSYTGISKPTRGTLDDRVKDAMELCNFAIAALKYNEVNLAKQRLQEALKSLE